MRTNAIQIFDGVEAKIEWELNRPSKKKIMVSAVFMNAIFVVLLLGVVS